MRKVSAPHHLGDSSRHAVVYRGEGRRGCVVVGARNLGRRRAGVRAEMERRGEVISVPALLLGAGAVWRGGLLRTMPAVPLHREDSEQEGKETALRSPGRRDLLYECNCLLKTAMKGRTCRSIVVHQRSCPARLVWMGAFSLPGTTHFLSISHATRPFNSYCCFYPDCQNRSTTRHHVGIPYFCTGAVRDRQEGDRRFQHSVG